MADTTADSRPAVDEQLAAQLVAQARSQGVNLVGEGGLLQKLTKLVLENALEGEMSDHLGYPTDDPAGRNGGNSRNGHRPKTVLTEIGPIDLEVPRDRQSSFEPKIVRKRQRRLGGVEDLVISLCAKRCDHRRSPSPPGRNLRCAGVPPDDLHDHRRGARRSGRMATPPLRPRLPGDFHRRDRAPRGATGPSGGERPSPSGRRSGLIEAEGSLIRGTPGRVASSPDNDGTAWDCQTGRAWQARREVYVRHQRRRSVSDEPAPTWWIWVGMQRTALLD